MAETRLSSPPSSLTPSPGERAAEGRPQKRPRIASPSPPSPADFVPRRSPGPRSASQGGTCDHADRRDEARAGNEAVTPAPAPQTLDGSDRDREPQGADAVIMKPSSCMTEDNAPLEPAHAAAKADEGDSGVAFLPDDEAKDKMQVDTVEVGAEVEVEADVEEELDFDGDDIWLGFDEGDFGFDQPQTFPSSALAPVPAPAPAPAPAAVFGVASKPDKLGADDAAPVKLDAPSEPRLKDFGFANFDASNGFTFATRKPFAISEKALQRAKALLEAEDEEAQPMAPPSAATSRPQLPAEQQAGPSRLPTPMRPHSASGAVRTSTPINDAAASPAVPASSPLRAAHLPPDDPRPGPSSSLGGFQNAAGRSLKMPSEAALQRSRHRLEAKSPSPTKGSSTILRPARPRAHSRSSPSKDPFAMQGASTTTGSPLSFRLKPIAMPLENNKAVEMPVMSSMQVSHSPLPTRLTPRADLGTASETHEASAPVAVSAAERGSSSVVKAEELSASTSQSRAQLVTASSPAGASTARDVGSETPLRPLPRRPQNPSAQSPHPLQQRPGTFRPPLLAGQNKSISHAAPPSTRTAASGPASTPLKSFRPATNPAQPETRRLSFGMTPRAKPFHLANTRLGTPVSTKKTGVKAFVTPFKGGKRPEGLTPMGLKDKIHSASAKPIAASTPRITTTSKQKSSGPSSGADSIRREKAKVFDLEAPRGATYDLTFGMRPQTHYYEHLEELGLPVELLSMDSKSGATYIFPCGRGVEAAYAALQELVAERMPAERDLVTLPWIKNHWALVLWKLASYVRSRPDLLPEWWSFERVMDQLRYRYEREVNRAQRPAIKRIQEHDSPASLPMVLCVSQIRWEETTNELENAEAHDTALTIVGLELTDGWYRIRANVDRTLKSACERGKIVLGCKLAISGAKLDAAGSEGTDVLKALNKSQLVISGNSTSLAPWHSKLGFTPEPFVASLGSLSPDGGLASLVDVFVERAFPCGYIDLRRGRGTETWSEEEELTRAEEWKLGRQRVEAKLADAMEKETTEEDALVELLQEAAERYHHSPKTAREMSPAEEPDEILDRIESATNKQAVIRQLDYRQVHAVLALAQENAQSSRYRAVEGLQKELADRYPPREVRGFRVLRVIDAREGTKKSQRTAQLTVWDAQSFEADFFREGQRYMISNLVPKGNWRPTDREISLATRRDTRWTKV